jgi:hypothetical protein
MKSDGHPLQIPSWLIDFFTQHGGNAIRSSMSLGEIAKAFV